MTEQRKEKVADTSNNFVKLQTDCKFFIIGYMTAVLQLRENSEPKKTA